MRKNSKPEWTLIEVSDDAYNLVRGRKEVLSNATLTQVKKYMRRNLEAGQRVRLEEADGYKREVTRWFHSHVRRPC